MEKKFESNTFGKRLKSMLIVDCRRLTTSPFFYIMVGIAFVIPVLILVMTTMMGGSAPTGENNVAAMESFDNVWQIIGSVGGAGMGMNMGLTGMCNINMMYFAVAIWLCIFIADDFRSGYAKNLFTVRAKKTDYVISKTTVGFIGAVAIFLAFFIGALLGGGIAKLPFEMEGFNVGNVVSCILSKMGLSLVFVAVCVLASVVGKQRAWLSVLLAFGFGMLFFTMIPMVTPLDSTAVHVAVCFAAGALFSIGLGYISNLVLKKTSLV